MMVSLRKLSLLSTPVARMALTPRWVSRRKDVKKFSVNISKLKGGIAHLISRRTTFSPNHHLVEETSCFPLFAPRYRLNELHRHMPLHKYQDFIFLLNRFVVYLLPTSMTSVTGNHTMELFYLFKENFKNLLFNSLITGWSFENLSDLSSCLLSQRLRFQGIRSNVLRGNGSDVSYTKVLEVVSRHILRSGSLWYPLSSSILKNKSIFSLVNSKLMCTFSLWLYNLV